MKLKDFISFKPGAGLLFLCLVLLPFISWLYIRQGVDFRVNALQELSMKVPLKNFQSHFQDSVLFNEDSMKGRVNIVLDFSESNDKALYKQLIESLYDQNEGSNDVRIVVCGLQNGLHDLNLASYTTKRQFTVSGSSEIPKKIKLYLSPDYLSKHPKDNAFIVDKTATLRASYDLKNKDDIKKLIRHSAVLVPEYKRVKPELVRQDNY